MLGSNLYFEKRFRKCSETYGEKFKDEKLAKIACNQDKRCNAIAHPTETSSDQTFKLCQGNFEFSEHHHIFARGRYILNKFNHVYSSIFLLIIYHIDINIVK